MAKNLSTRIHFSDIQVFQLSAESITLSGLVNFHGVLQSKGVEIDATVTDPVNQNGYALKYDSVLGKILLLPDISGSTVSANNGLTKTGNIISLGGSLIGDTLINLSGYNLNFQNGFSNFDYVKIQNVGINLSGATHGMSLIFSSGTTSFNPGYIDFNTLVNVPDFGGRASIYNKKMPVLSGSTDGMLVCNQGISGTTSPDSYVTVFLDGIEFSTGGTGSTFYFSSEYAPLGNPTTYREKGEEQKGDYCYANPSKLPWNVITSDMLISFHYLTTE